MSTLLRSLTPPWFVVVGVVAFLSAEALLQWVERRLGVPALDLKIRPSLLVLYLVAVIYGVYRATVRHPFFNRRYHDWLTQTPWTVAKPLPLGPIQLDGRDAVVLGLLVSLNLPSPIRDSMRILCGFLFVHGASLTLANWYTTNRAYSYLAAFGLTMMIRLASHPWGCFATSAAVYLVAYEGVWQALRAFPWEQSLAVNKKDANNPMLNEQAVRDGKGKPPPCGWPYDQLLRDPLAPIPSPQSGLDALIWCLLLGWWISCLATRFTLQSDAEGFVSVCTTGVFFVSILWRFGVYIAGYIPPLSFLGRIATGRLIVPEYDVIFVAPLLLFLAAAAAAVGFSRLQVPLDVSLPIIASLITFIALRTPPSLKQWRLTGGHRMIPNGVGVTSDAVDRTWPSLSNRDVMKYLFSPLVLLRRGCPECGHRMFRSPLSMYEECPGCGLDFDRGQPGYFTGAMYVSYGAGIPIIALLTLIEHLLIPSWSLFRLVLLAWALCLPFIPWIWQYSRVIWVHFDQWIDPSRNDREEPFSLTED